MSAQIPADPAEPADQVAPSPLDIKAELEGWRARAAWLLSVVVAIAGVPTYGFMVTGALLSGRGSPLLWVYAAAYAVFVLLAAVPRPGGSFRAWVFLFAAYVNAAASMARLGLLGSGRLFLAILPPVATILIGPRAGYLAAAASLAMFSVFTVLARTGSLERWLTERSNSLAPDMWAEAAGALAILLFTLVVLVERFYALHIRTLTASRKAASDLELLAERLREREERLGLVMQGTNDGIWDWNVATDEVYFSPRWKSMLGYGEDEIANLFASWRALLHPDDAERALAEVNAYLQGCKPVFELEHRLRAKDGSYRWILARGIALRDAAGRATRMVGAHTDVSERRRTQAELRAAYETLEQRVSERTRELAVLNSLAEVVSRSLDLGEIMSAALEKTTEAVGVEAGAAYRLDEQTLVMMAQRGLSVRFARFVSLLPLATIRGDGGGAAETLLSRPVDDYLDGELRSRMQAEGLRLVILVPLAAKGRLLGGIMICTRAERSLSPEESSLLVAIGRQVGLAVENARLYHLERARHEEAERRRTVAEGMRETLAVLNSDHSLEQTLSFIVSQASRLMGSDAASLLRLESPDGLMRIQSAYGLEPDYVASISFSPGRGGAGRALTERRPLVVADATAFLAGIAPSEEAMFEEEKKALELMVSRGYHAILSVPLVVKDEDYGGITLYYRRAREFSDEEIQLAMGVADQAALAIENARLRAQAEQSAAFAERSRLARDLHDSVTQSLYSVTLYAEAVARMLEAGDSGNAVGHLRELRATAQDALREMRLLIFQLSPPALSEGGLAASLQTRLDAVETRGGAAVTFETEGSEHLPPATARELYQIAQEALNNIVKHARARRVTVRLRFEERLTRLEIGDDGAGFDVEGTRQGGGLGLRGMTERVQRLGGTLSIESAPGGGTRIVVELR